MKYKVGDRVIIKSLDWYKKTGDNYAFIIDEVWFTHNMVKYCGMETIITRKYSEFYTVECDKGHFVWSNGMFEDIKNVRKKKLEKLYEV